MFMSLHTGLCVIQVLLRFLVICGGAGMTVTPPDKTSAGTQPGHSHTQLLPSVHVKVLTV